jgi:type IV pilus assembly protein PilY1
LRGDLSKDKSNNGDLRDRPKLPLDPDKRNVMGDIVNSDPAFVKNKDFGYIGLNNAAGSSYAQFVSDNGNRLGMVYVGANDGRMYGIQTEGLAGGQEKFSYVPEAVYPNLSRLTDPSYTHRYYADGSIQYGDAYLDNQWKTILVAGLNAGGKAVYALDITHPETFDANNVLWEFDPRDDPKASGDPSDDLGYTYSRPQVGVLENDTWVAVFGNGYSSKNGGAYLYVVDLKTGKLIRKILASDQPAQDESNGLSTPALVDRDNNSRIDTIYAGDLKGNLWKFNVKAGSEGAWTATSIFEAKDRGGNSQPITAQPKVVQHPTQGGHLLLFGTGRYLTADDVANKSEQTFYGVWDKDFGGAPSTRANLQAQSFDYQQDNLNAAGTVRSITNENVDWGTEKGWYLDLLDLRNNGTTRVANGERIIHAANVAETAVIFGSVVPTTDPCEPGGYSFLYALSFENGGSMNQVVFDTDDSGTFDDKDTVVLANRDKESTLVGGVMYSDFGLANVAALIQGTEEGKDADVIYAELAGTRDKLLSQGLCLKQGGCGPEEEEETKPTVVRRSWIQIR